MRYKFYFFLSCVGINTTGDDPHMNRIFTSSYSCRGKILNRSSKAESTQGNINRPVFFFFFKEKKNKHGCIVLLWRKGKKRRGKNLAIITLMPADMTLAFYTGPMASLCRLGSSADGKTMRCHQTTVTTNTRAGPLVLVCFERLMPVSLAREQSPKLAFVRLPASSFLPERQRWVLSAVVSPLPQTKTCVSCYRLRRWRLPGCAAWRTWPGPN